MGPAKRIEGGRAQRRRGVRERLLLPPFLIWWVNEYVHFTLFGWMRFFRPFILGSLFEFLLDLKCAFKFDLIFFFFFFMTKKTRKNPASCASPTLILTNNIHHPSKPHSWSQLIYSFYFTRLIGLIYGQITFRYTHYLSPIYNV